MGQDSNFTHFVRCVRVRDRGSHWHFRERPSKHQVRSMFQNAERMYKDERLRAVQDKLRAGCRMACRPGSLQGRPQEATETGGMLLGSAWDCSPAAQGDAGALRSD